METLKKHEVKIMLTNIKKKKRDNERKPKREKKAILKKTGVTKKSANLIRNHDEEFRVACS